MVQFSSLYRELLSIELGNSDTAALFTIGRRKSAINKGLQEFADLTECYTRTWYTGAIPSSGGGSTVLKVGEWSLSTLIADADFSRFGKAPVRFLYTDAAGNQTYLEGKDLPRRDRVWLSQYWPGWELTTIAAGLQQLPQLYYVEGDQGAEILGFVPRPSTGSSASMALEIPYVARPAALSSDTNEPFRGADGIIRPDLRAYHQALVHYAAAKLELLRRDTGASQTQMQTFLSYVARYLGQSRQKGGTVVTYVRNYFRVRGADRGRDPRV